MSPIVTIQRRLQVIAVGGMALALCGVTGCGPKPVPASAKAPVAAKSAPAAAADAAATNEYASVFEDLSPQEGKDPFFPTSHRRDPVAAPTAEAPVVVKATLVLKGILHAGKNSQAVINTRIFETGDDLSVTVPNGKVQVHCLEIGSDYVLVQVAGEPEPKRLVMEQKK